MDDLHKKLKKFKISLELNDTHGVNDDILQMHDVSLECILPNNKVFQLDPNKLVVKDRRLIKSHFKVNTDEKFYKNGVIDNMFFTQPRISLDYQKDDAKTWLLHYFSTHICGHNWLLSFNLFLHYTSLTNASSLDFVKTKEVRLLNIGNGKGDFISGMYYYFLNSNISKVNNETMHLRQYDLKWLGIDTDNNASNIHFRKFNKLLNTNVDPETYDIIHGFATDDILEYKNLMYVKTMVDNKFGDVNVLYNNIKPRMVYKKSKIMLSIAILSLYSLNINGLMITKILEPEYWDSNFIDYLVLFSLIFNKTDIFRFPVNKKHKTYYRYYLVGCCKKNLVYNSILGRKLMFVLHNDNIEQPKLLSDITDCDEINKWKQRLLIIQSAYTSTIVNPTVELQKNINQLQEII